jgi:hypothetical protein
MESNDAIVALPLLDLYSALAQFNPQSILSSKAKITVRPGWLQLWFPDIPSEPI